MTPLITRVNSPRVRMVTGRVSRMTSGLRNAFSRPRTSVATSRSLNRSIWMPGTSFITKNRAKAFKIQVSKSRVIACARLQPPLPPEIDDHCDREPDHEPPEYKVAAAPLQFRHMLEIHAIHADQKGQRHEDGADYGQKLHDFIDAVTDAGKVQVKHPGEEVAICFNGVDNLNGVVVDVAEIEACRWREQVAIPPLQKRDRLPERPDGLAQEDDLLLDIIDLVQGCAVRCQRQLFLKIDDPLSQVFQHAEVTVNDGVDQGIGQIIGSHTPGLALVVAEPLPDHIKDIALQPFLEGEDMVAAQDNAELLGGKLTPSRRPQHAQDKEQVGVVVLDLGTLDSVDNILQNKRM